MTVHELKAELDQNPASWTILDVRTAEELQLCHIQSCLWIPLDELTERISELTHINNLAVLCHHGVRSDDSAILKMPVLLASLP